jgi:hypothetical protein
MKPFLFQNFFPSFSTGVQKATWTRAPVAAQRECVFQAFGPSKEMQLYNRGIRRRLAPMLDNDRAKLELAFSLLFTLPGTPMLRLPGDSSPFRCIFGSASFTFAS